jgi:hypothetical protein
VIRGRGLAGYAHVRAGPLACPRVDLTIGAVGPLDADGDRDGVAAVVDIKAVDLAAPLIGNVFDRLAVHYPIIEQVFGCV